MEHRLLNCPVSHRLTPGAVGSDTKLNLMVKLEQKNCEPRDENIQLNGINTVCLRREWYFNVFTGLAHKYLWSVHSEGRMQSTQSREQQSGSSRSRGGKADTHPGRPCVLLDLGTGLPSDCSPVILPGHFRTVPFMVWSTEPSGNARRSRQPSPGQGAVRRQGPLPSPGQPPCSPSSEPCIDSSLGKACSSGP